MSKINEAPRDRPWLALKQHYPQFEYSGDRVNDVFAIKTVIEPVIQQITEAEEDVFAEFLIGLGWTPPEGSRWSK